MSIELRSDRREGKEAGIEEGRETRGDKNTS
jgi:hypothetical protein